VVLIYLCDRLLEIKVGSQSTYYRLLVYAVELQDSVTEDTGLTIDSDMLSDATHIILCKDGAGKYVLKLTETRNIDLRMNVCS
jgi:hypothetical protein